MVVKRFFFWYYRISRHDQTHGYQRERTCTLVSYNNIYIYTSGQRNKVSKGKRHDLFWAHNNKNIK